MNLPRRSESLRPRPMQRPGGRTERVRQHVVAATVALLAERGVAGVSVENVATRSGVARTTIYRRWRTPEALILEALLDGLVPNASPVRDTGSLRGDLHALMEDLIRFVSSEQGRGIMQAVFMKQTSPEFVTAIRSYWDQRFETVGAIARRAVARGELADDTQARLIIEMVTSPVYFRLFVTHDEVDEAYLSSVLDFVLGALGVDQPSPVSTAEV